MSESRPRSGVTERKLKRKSPAKGKDLELIMKRLCLNNHTEALEEAITVLLLITDEGRKSFLLEERGGGIIKISF